VKSQYTVRLFDSSARRQASPVRRSPLILCQGEKEKILVTYWLAICSRRRKHESDNYRTNRLWLDAVCEIKTVRHVVNQRCKKEEENERRSVNYEPHLCHDEHFSYKLASKFFAALGRASDYTYTSGALKGPRVDQTT
jgi:hypothetical protein